MTTQALTIHPLDALARHINEAQHLIERHALRMLEWARFAGEHLIAAKKQCPHGTFKAWVEANCRVSYDQAKKYQAIAKGWDRLEKCPKALSDLTINAAYELVRGENTKPTKAPSSNLPTFTQDDAEYALKIAARIDSDFEGESAVAKAKLEGFAKGLGMTGEECLEKAKALKPDAHLTDAESTKQGLRAEILAPFANMSRDELLDAIFTLIRTFSRERK